MSDETFSELAERLPERELVFVLGYFTLVSMTLNVFQVALPEGESLPLD
ncbi:MAG: hypothetical protein GY910_25160 [bacterium]|nr:hypothetical protein [bacterium]